MSDGEVEHGAMRTWGWVEPVELERVVLVSPHPDDSVISCGQFLAAHPGVEVITVFAGSPARYPDPPAWWDALCGFEAGDDIVALRRHEDQEALDLLGASVRWLDCVEAHFQPDERDTPVAEVTARLEPALRSLRPTLVLLPMGLANPEHVSTHEAVLEVRRQWAGRFAEEDLPGWIAYEDIAYKQIPGQLAWRVTKLFRSSLWPTPVAMPVDPSPRRKREAVARYRSQVRGLEADWSLWARLDAPTPEQYWRLEPPLSGWEAMIDLA